MPPASLVVSTAALVVAALALVVAVASSRRLRARPAAAPVAPLPAGGDALRREVAALRAQVEQARAEAGSALRHVAVVRYDAFDDLAGRLSFSAALLDDNGDGVVVTSINGRSETRTYAKGVVGGGSGHPLSPEEKEAVARARGDRPAVGLVAERAG